MNDTQKLPPPAFPLLESLDSGRTFTEVWMMGTSPLADLFANADTYEVLIGDVHGDLRIYRRPAAVPTSQIGDTYIGRDGTHYIVRSDRNRHGMVETDATGPTGFRWSSYITPDCGLYTKVES